MKRRACNTPFPPKEASTLATKLSKKVIEAVSRFLAAVVFCYPNTRSHTSTICKRLEDLPNEILLKILTYCDFTSKMNTRVLNYRFYCLIEKGAHTLPRRNLVGGVEIRRGSSDQRKDIDAAVPAPVAYPGFLLMLSRPLKHLDILVPATRVTNIMRLLCGVSLDEVLASNILDASFRTVSDVIIDHVGAVTAETLSKLVRKIHRTFDDSALVRLVVSDQAVRRAVRLPVCAITHHGISHAAQAFYKRCCDVMDELTAEMHEPQWEISVSFPHSIMIDRNLIKVPIGMRGQCMIWEFLPHYGNGFTVEVCPLIYETFEVRVGGMNLRIVVESS
ncbi:unnamed protein product [Angiostrongylus costaricensis]|uniref:F-box domain-containing protein n=1 Tax=Angiostrongylus costaricensis TaxID=334426 RepID=A0A0R3P9Z9_ANGCS|nr:unnamed protein product [Angiostrongylus costaricensis]